VGTVTQYLASLEEPARTLLGHYRARALALVPTADEGTSYGMAALRYRRRPLIAVQRIKIGYAVYPFSPEVVASVLPTIEGFASTKGGIRFTNDHPLPDAAYDALVTGRRDEIDAALARR
jgi:uncharacterized protein YdhG (YjbR/CyaY superfamily)